ncbi:MAG: rRNA maturation RNase YbeY [Flavobacteriaceae bacterium]|nr:rRNA maturation RNase YbeY [Flavobacteriaceae bacterium]
MIEFFSETDFALPNEIAHKQWIANTIKEEGFTLGELSFVFCDDVFLHKINVEFLNHDTLTDIITFDYNMGKQIHGEIYISTERVQENSEEFAVSFEEELRRVIIHGVLHLCGFKDKTPSDEKIMRFKEDQYLSLFSL